MTEFRWKRTFGQMMLIAMLLMVWLLYNIIFVIMIIAIGEVDLMFILSLVFVPLIMLLGYYFTKKQWGEVWYSTSRLTGEPSFEVGPLLEKGLAEENVPFTKRGDTLDDTVSSSIAPWLEVYHLSSCFLKIHVYPHNGTTTVYVGPLSKDNLDEVEKVKGLIDRALG